jgi:hypothetical protein
MEKPGIRVIPGFSTSPATRSESRAAHGLAFPAKGW